jgi:hypothetical protein
MRDIARELEIAGINKKLSVIATEITGLKKDAAGLDAKTDRLEIRLKSEFSLKLNKHGSGFDSKIEALSKDFEIFKFEIEDEIKAAGTWKNQITIIILITFVCLLVSFLVKVLFQLLI